MKKSNEVEFQFMYRIFWETYSQKNLYSHEKILSKMSVSLAHTESIGMYAQLYPGWFTIKLQYWYYEQPK